jgi:alkylhydroperoxidase/carboxymuconolactone decarboxylase family protein YurZ
MEKNPFQTFVEEFPDISAKFNALVKAQQEHPSMDTKTKQLIVIAIHTVHHNKLGVKLHAQAAKQEGATREEVLGAVILNLHLSGLATVLDCLPAAIEGYDDEES